MYLCYFITKEVYNAISNGADKTGGYAYDSNGWHVEMGFGRVNAYNTLFQTDISTATPTPNIFATTTNIVNSEENIVQIYPNPVDDNITIVLKENDNFEGFIYNIVGKLIYNLGVVNNNSKIRISELSKGVYYVLLKDNKTNRSNYARFVKK